MTDEEIILSEEQRKEQDKQFYKDLVAIKDQDEPITETIPGISEEEIKQLDPKLIRFCLQIRKRLRSKRDAPIGVTGEPGNGKSTGINGTIAKLIDPNFDLKKNVCFVPEGEEVRDKFRAIDKHGVLVIDEAVRAFHKHGWADRIQQMVMRLYDTERFRCKCTFFLMPRWANFTENFRNNRLAIWLDFICRGKVMVYIKIPDKDWADPWNIKLNQNIKLKAFGSKRAVNITLQDRLEVERKLPNYAFEFAIPDWRDKALEEEYERLKLESRTVEEANEDKRSQAFLWKDRFFHSSFHHTEEPRKFKSQKEYCELIDIEKAEYSRGLRAWKIEKGLDKKESDKESSIINSQGDT